MRTLLYLALESTNTTEALFNYVFAGKPTEQSRDYVRPAGALLSHRCDLAFDRWVGDVIQRSKLVAFAIWSCGPEDEEFALELARNFPQRVRTEVGDRVDEETYLQIIRAVADEFVAPNFPKSMAKQYPYADYHEDWDEFAGEDEDEDDDDYETYDAAFRSVEDESRYYGKWLLRRKFYQSVYSALLG